MEGGSARGRPPTQQQELDNDRKEHTKMTKRIGNIVSALVFALLLALCLGITAVRLSGLGTYIVTGGSMEPSIHKGSLVIVQPVDAAEIAVGDVITFQQ